MSDDTKDAVKDKFAQRFENEDKSSQTPEEAKTSKPDQISGAAKNAKTVEKVNIKEDWKNHSFYLPDELADDLTSHYKRLDWELDDELDQEFKKTRHYYPLIVALGLDQLEGLESEDIKERLEDIEF